MSERLGNTTKGKDGKKYSALNLYETYKGKSVEQQKQPVSHGRGLQSLGKVGSARRMPPPAPLPSLKSENQGNDPNITLVPGGSQGWTGDKKEASGTSTPPLASTPPQAAPIIPPQETGQNKNWSQQQQPATDIIPQEVVRAPPPSYKNPAPSAFQQDFPSLGSGDPPAQGSAPAATKGDAKKTQPPAPAKEAQYGPGPSLRPQNVASWREGGSSLNRSGGTGTGEGEASPNREKEGGGAGGGGKGGGPGPGAMVPPPMGVNGAPGVPHMVPGPVPPQFRGMMPPYMYGPGPGPGGFPPGAPPGPRGRYPMPGFPPGMQGPPRPGYPQRPDQRMPAPGPGRGPPPRAQGRPGTDDARPLIVSGKKLIELDKIGKEEDMAGWAGAHGEVDYSEKLVFSDDDEDSPKKNYKNRRSDGQEKPRRKNNGEDERRRRPPPQQQQPPPQQQPPQQQPPPEREEPVTREDEPSPNRNQYPEEERERRPPRDTREAWAPPPGPPPPQMGGMPPPPPHGRVPPPGHGPGPGRMPPNMEPQGWNRGMQPPFDQRGPPPPSHYARMQPHFQHPMGPGPHGPPPPGSHGPPPPGSHGPPPPGGPHGPPPAGPHGPPPPGPHGPPPPGPHGPPQPGPHGPPQPPPPPPHHAQAGQPPIQKQPIEDDETWKHRQKKQSDEMTAVIERARQRRLEEEKIEEEQRLKGAQEKLRRLEERMAERAKEDGSSDNAEEKGERSPGTNHTSKPELPGGGGGKRQRTESGSSDGSRQGRDRAYGRQTSRNLPPRFLKQQQQQHQQVPPAQGGERRPPPFGQMPEPGTQQGPPVVGPPVGPPGAHPGRVPPQDHREMRGGWGGGPPPPGQVPFMGDYPPRGPRPGAGMRIERRHKDSTDSQGSGGGRTPEPLEDVQAPSFRPQQPHPQGDKHPPVTRDAHQDHRKFDANHHKDFAHPPSNPPNQWPKQEAVEQREGKKNSGPALVDHSKEDGRHNRENQEPAPAKQQVEPIKKEQEEVSKSANHKPPAREDHRSAKQNETAPKQHPRPERQMSNSSQKSVEHERPYNRQSNHGAGKDRKHESGGNQHRSGPGRPYNERKASTSSTDSRHSAKEHSDKKPHGKDRAPLREREFKNNKDNERREPKPIAVTEKANATEKPVERAPPAAEKPKEKQELSTDRNNKAKGATDKPGKEMSKDVKDHKPRENKEHKEHKDDRNRERRDNRDYRDYRDHHNKDSRDHPDSRDRRDRDRGDRGAPNKRRDVTDKPSNRRRDDGVKRDRGRGSRYETGGRGRGVRPYASSSYRGGRGRGERRYPQDTRRPPAPSKRSKEEDDFEDYSSEDEPIENAASAKETKAVASKPAIVNGEASNAEIKDSQSAEKSEGNDLKRKSEDDTDSRDTESKPNKKQEVNQNGPGSHRYDKRDEKDKRGNHDRERRNYDRDRRNDDRDRRNDDRDNRRHDDRDRRNDDRDRRNDDRNRRRGNDDHRGDRRNYDDDRDRKGFQPRGEPSRRGRGGAMVGRGRGRGGSTRGGGGGGGGGTGRTDRRDTRRDDYQEGYRDKENDRDRFADKRNKRNDKDTRKPRSEPRPRPERPPRFQRGTRGRGRGRFPQEGRLAGATPRKAGSGRGSTGSSSEGSSPPSSKPVLQKQNSSDQNNEEWETASESSDFNDRKPKEKEVNDTVTLNNDVKDDIVNDKKETAFGTWGDCNSAKRGFTTQRPGSDRGTRRPDVNEWERDNNISGGRGGRRGGRGGSRGVGDRRGGGRDSGSKRVPPGKGGQPRKDGQSREDKVYRVDGMVLNNPDAVKDALTDLSNRSSAVQNKKSSGNSKGSSNSNGNSNNASNNNSSNSNNNKSKSLQEKKRDVLASYDLNNYASVVVVDDVPEVIVENPDELLTPDEGFQEVVSKRASKERLKAQQQEAERKKVDLTMAEAVKKPKLGTNMKLRHQQSKLPPRFRGQVNAKENSRDLVKDPMVIPSLAAVGAQLPTVSQGGMIGVSPGLGTLNKAPGTMPIGAEINSRVPSTVDVMMPLGAGALIRKVTASPPPVNAWDKPLQRPPLITGSGNTATVAPQVAMSLASVVAMPKAAGKPENDQHDSGIELNSDHHASNPPSTRSSPSGEGAKTDNKLVQELMVPVMEAPSESQEVEWQDEPLDLQGITNNPPQPIPGIKQITLDDVKSIIPDVDRNAVNAVPSNVDVNLARQPMVLRDTAVLGQTLSDVRNSEPSVSTHMSNDLRAPVSVEPPVPASSSHMPKDLPVGPAGPSGQTIELPTSSAEDFTKKMESTKALWDSFTIPSDSALSPPGMNTVAAQNEDMSSTTSDHAVETDTLRDIPQHRVLVSDSTILLPPASSSVGVSFGNFNTRDTVVAPSVPNSAAATYDTSHQVMGNIEIPDIQEIPEVVANRNPIPNHSQSFSSSMPVVVSDKLVPSSGYSTKPLSLYTVPSTTHPAANVNSAALQLYPSMTAFGMDIKQQQPSNEKPAQLFPSVVLAQQTSQLTPITPSPSLFSQVLTTQYSPLPSSDRVLSSSGFAAQNQFAAQSVIQPPSGNYQYNMNQGHTVAASPPAAAQQTFAPIGFLPAAQPQHQQQHTHTHTGLQNNIGAILSSALTQPTVPNQPYGSYSSTTPFSRGHELSANSAVIVKPQQNSYPGNIGAPKTASLTHYGSVSNVAVQQAPLYGQQRASTQHQHQHAQVGAQTGLVGNSLVAAMQPLAHQHQAHQHQAQQSSFFTGNAAPAQAHHAAPAPPPQAAPQQHQSAGAAAAAAAAGSTNFFNSLQGMQSTLQGTPAAIQPPTPTMQPMTIQLPPSAPPPAPPSHAPGPAHQLQYQSQTAGASTQLSHSQPPSLALPSQPAQLPPQRVNTRPTTLVGFQMERKPMQAMMHAEQHNMAALNAQSGGSEHLFQQPRALSPKSSDMQQHVDAKPFSPNRQQAPVMSRQAFPPQYHHHQQPPPQQPPPTVMHQQAAPMVSKPDHMSLAARMDMAMHASSAPPQSWSVTTQLSTSQLNMPVYTQAQTVPQSLPKSVITTQPTSTPQSRTGIMSTSVRPPNMNVPPPPIQQANVTGMPPPPRVPRPGSARMPFPNQTYITHPMGHMIRLPGPSAVNTRFRAPSGPPPTSMAMPPHSAPTPVMSCSSVPTVSTPPSSTISAPPPPSKPALQPSPAPMPNASAPKKSYGPGPSPAMMRPGGKNGGPKPRFVGGSRGPQLSPEEIKANQVKEREALLASTKAFFAPQESKTNNARDETKNSDSKNEIEDSTSGRK